MHFRRENGNSLMRSHCTKGKLTFGVNLNLLKAFKEMDKIENKREQRYVLAERKDNITFYGA